MNNNQTYDESSPFSQRNKSQFILAPSNQLYYDYSITEYPKYKSDQLEYKPDTTYDLNEHKKRLLSTSNIDNSFLSSPILNNDPQEDKNILSESNLRPKSPTINSNVRRNKIGDIMNTSRSPNRINSNRNNITNQSILDNGECGYYNPSLMSSKREKLRYLINFLKDTTENLTKFEEKKEQLVKFNELNLSDIFALFDLDDDGKVTKKNFNDVLNKYFELYYIEEDFDILYNIYDLCKDDKLSYKEFSIMIMPRKIEYAKIFASHKPEKVFTKFSKEAYDLLRDIFDSLMKMVRDMQQKKINLFSYPTFNCYECFELIKDAYDEVIYKDNFNAFLKKCGIYLTEFELNLIFFTINTNSDSKITFSEFVKFIRPFHKIKLD